MSEMFIRASGNLFFVGPPPATKEEASMISIAKWKKVVKFIKRNGKLIGEGGTSTCGYCMLYFLKSCEGCPVFVNTGKMACLGTPYYTYTDARSDEFDDPEAVGCGLIAAKDELAYLKSLSVPKMETKMFRAENGSVVYYGPKPVNLEEALDLSIEKWKFISEVLNDGVLIRDGAMESCGLCMLYFTGGYPRCNSCPVFQETGYPGCADTPYMKYTRAVAGEDPERAMYFAGEEIGFLEGLRDGND